MPLDKNNSNNQVQDTPDNREASTQVNASTPRQPEETSSTRRIAKNAMMLYLRMFLSMIVSLYTSRVVLNTLGVEDYGVYGIVGGVVGMLSFLNASMSGATSRFLAFEIGRGDKKRLSDTFSSALIAHIGIALIVFLIAETVGLWFLTHKLVIPAGRMTAAHWVYQLSIFSTMLGITQAPYNATIIAHEKMDIYAYVEILNVTLKLLIVYLLVIGNFDKLILYASLVFAVSILIMMGYRIYCIRHFEESHFHWVWDKSILKPLLSFSGWDLYGNMAHTVRAQGSNFIFNAFYGVVLNAACGIASTVQGVLLSFSTNIVTAFKPPIIKAYSICDYELTNRNLKYAAKIACAFITIVSVPVYVKCEYVLTLWLKTVPDGTVFITRLSLLMNLATCVSLIVLIGIHATGRMLRTGAFSGTIFLLTLPLMYILLKSGFSYRACYVLFLTINCINLMVFSVILRFQMPQFKIVSFYMSVIIPAVIVVSLSLFCSFRLATVFKDSILNFVLFVISSVLTTSVLSFLLLMNANEKRTTIQLLKKKIH